MEAFANISLNGTKPLSPCDVYLHNFFDNGTEWNVDKYLELCVAVKRHPYPYLIPLTVIHIIMFITGISGNVLGTPPFTAIKF